MLAIRIQRESGAARANEISAGGLAGPAPSERVGSRGRRQGGSARNGFASSPTGKLGRSTSHLAGVSLANAARCSRIDESHSTEPRVPRARPFPSSPDDRRRVSRRMANQWTCRFDRPGRVEAAHRSAPHSLATASGSSRLVITAPLLQQTTQFLCSVCRRSRKRTGLALAAISTRPAHNPTR